MTEVVRFELDDGGELLVEVADGEEFGLEEVALGDGMVVRRAQRGLGDALDAIRRMASQAHDRLAVLAVPPDVVELQFGVKLTGETGAVVARTTAEAQLTVRLVWERGTSEDAST
jgi:hypothetical protein